MFCCSLEIPVVAVRGKVGHGSVSHLVSSSPFSSLFCYFLYQQSPLPSIFCFWFSFISHAPGSLPSAISVFLASSIPPLSGHLLSLPTYHVPFSPRDQSISNNFSPLLKAFLRVNFSYNSCQFQNITSSSTLQRNKTGSRCQFKLQHLHIKMKQCIPINYKAFFGM